MKITMMIGAFLLLGAITTGSQANPASQTTPLSTETSPSTDFSLEEKGKFNFSNNTNQTTPSTTQTSSSADFILEKKGQINFSSDIDLPPYNHVRAMTFSPDGRYINTGVRFAIEESNKAVRDGEELHDIQYGGEYITYDISQINQPVEVEKTAVFNYDNSFTPDGRHLVRIDVNGQIVIENVEDMKHPAYVMSLPWQDATDNEIRQASCVEVSNSGTFMVAGGRDGLIKIYNITDPKNPTEQSTIETDHTLTDVAISPDEKWVAFTGNGFSLMVYDLADLSNPRLLATEKTPGDKPGLRSVGVTIAPDSKWLAVAGYTLHHSLLLYDMEHPEKPALIPVPEEVKGPVSFVDISRDGKLMAMGTLGEGAGVTIYNVADPKKAEEVDFIAAITNSYGGAFSPVKDQLALDLGDQKIGLFTYSYNPASPAAVKPRPRPNYIKPYPQNPTEDPESIKALKIMIIVPTVAAVTILVTFIGLKLHDREEKRQLKKAVPI
ncbi:WD40 repeat domain-containing protein [Endozoicomonas gorgoniicola]|uniref:WD40 repeat domain-containing protein n=1 Tax=Endozoicomonas gorgoniicola TaxID=1234144 RepID=A0ABT3MR66_9GAMM|nr:WD40 repeat domain-containing protein [Endozoicomonas gorgoniicola]MCW7551859.1 WD40 repeat domain-containing protein [Endozoicomonas gorgoniicola]